MPANETKSALQFWYSRIAAHHDKETQQYLSLLPLAQQRYYKQLQHPRRAQQYLFSRLLICTALSERFNQPLNYWQIEERRHSTPLIHNLPTGYISLTHSKSLIGFALSDNNVGIDLEYKKSTRDFISAAELFMSLDEINAMPKTTLARKNYFYQLWCAKEALYKALPAAQQSQATLTSLCYQDLKMENTPWYLYEATIDQYQLAIIANSIYPESLHISELKL